VEEVADPGYGGGEHFDDVNARRGRRRGNAHDGHEQGVADHAERHAKRAVDELRGKADKDEGEDRRKIERGYFVHNIIPILLIENLLAAFAGPRQPNFSADGEGYCFTVTQRRMPEPSQ
jgi:hypothetical protein